ncbi:hypothetical protein [Actinomyces oricola]|uniref:hypothetical protein n=1 Tax=Actinomyces oricola TaxID=206043 RepID=UPI000FFF3BC8|nr:hypothetical protein [Actinomyces oricola]
MMLAVAIITVLFGTAIRYRALGAQSDLASDNAKIFLRDNRPLAVLVLVGLLSNVWAGVFNAQYPLLLLRVIGMPPQMYGINSTMLNGGLICASLLFFLLANRVDSWSYATAADLIRCGSLGMMVFFTEIPLQFGAAFMYGLAMGVWNSGSSSATLRLAKGPYQRQYLAKSRSVVFAGAPIGSLVGAFTGSFEISHVMIVLMEGYSQGFAGFRRRRPERMVGNRGCGMEWFPPPGGLPRWVT